MKKIAIIGSGISGLTAAHLLHKQFDITLFEKNDYLGGHTHTVDVNTEHGDYAVDTAFIVFNPKTYPNFIKLLEQLNVAIQTSNMSFSFSSEQHGLEYSGDGLNQLFAQRKNIYNLKFLRLLKDIYSFNRSAKAFLMSPKDELLEDFVSKKRYGNWFTPCYLIPLAAAIWSSPPQDIGQIPAQFILDFYHNHGLLDLFKRPQWYVIKGGSREYIRALTKPFADNILLNTPVNHVIRHDDRVVIETTQDQYTFDGVVMACHSDQALQLLANPSDDEQRILSAIPFFDNNVILHTDHRVLPNSQRAWASWNYRQNHDQKPSLTYYMNKLQSIEAPVSFCVSVNEEDIAEDKIIDTYHYQHPMYSKESVAAKAQHGLINNTQRTFYCGAYWGNGFHEDGVVSSLQALAPLGVSL